MLLSKNWKLKKSARDDVITAESMKYPADKTFLPYHAREKQKRLVIDR